MFNRIIDVNEIASVILDNGLAFSVNSPHPLPVFGRGIKQFVAMAESCRHLQNSS